MADTDQVQPLESKNEKPAENKGETCWNCKNQDKRTKNRLNADEVCETCGFDKKTLYNGELEADKAAQKAEAARQALRGQKGKIMGNTPIRKAANVNVSPVGNQGNNAQSNILPSHKVAAPFGSVDRASVLPTRNAGVTPTGVPINDADAGNGTGNVRNTAKKNSMPTYMGVD